MVSLIPGLNRINSIKLIGIRDAYNVNPDPKYAKQYGFQLGRRRKTTNQWLTLLERGVLFPIISVDHFWHTLIYKINHCCDFFLCVVSVWYWQYISHVPFVKNNSVKRFKQTIRRIIQNNILYERSSRSYKTCPFFRFFK